MKITSESGPDSGKGRWVWPEYILKDKKLIQYMHDEGIKIQESLNNLELTKSQSDTNNAQIL